MFHGPGDSTSTFIQVMAWHQKYNKPLPEQMMNNFIDVCIQGLDPLHSFNSLSDAYMHQ